MTPETEDNMTLMEELKRELMDLRAQLDRERRLRQMIEEQKIQLEQQIHAADAERLCEIRTRIPYYYQPAAAQEVHLFYC